VRGLLSWLGFGPDSSARFAPIDGSGAASAFGSFRSAVEPQFGRTVTTLTVLSLALGMLLAAQLQSRPIKQVTAEEGSREAAAQTIKQLENEQADLKKQIADLRAQTASLQKTSGSGGTTLQEIGNELERQKQLAGMVPLVGRGVKVTLDDSATTKIPASDDPNLYIVHEYHLRDVLNLLWQAGADAVSLNGERIVATTSVYCVGSTILVNDTRLSPPYEFLAIGEQPALEAALNDGANLQSLRGRVRTYGVQFGVSRAAQLTIPAYSGSLGVKYATLGGKDVGAEEGKTAGGK
jgi:uncharacterized protein YlxW (UPF0749 family)